MIGHKDGRNFHGIICISFDMEKGTCGKFTCNCTIFMEILKYVFLSRKQCSSWSQINENMAKYTIMI